MFIKHIWSVKIYNELGSRELLHCAYKIWSTREPLGQRIGISDTGRCLINTIHGAVVLLLNIYLMI